MLKEENLIDTGVFAYTRDKDLHLFLLKQKELPDTKIMKCKSFFLDKTGRQLPEVDGYKYISFAEKERYLAGSMARVISSLQEQLRRIKLL